MSSEDEEYGSLSHTRSPTPSKEDVSSFPRQICKQIFDYLQTVNNASEPLLLKAYEDAWQRTDAYSKAFFTTLINVEEQTKEQWLWRTLDIIRRQQTHLVAEERMLFKEALEKQLHTWLDSWRSTVILTGPPKSGKSTLLALIAQELMFEFSSNGQWKNTVVLAVTWSRFLQGVDNDDRALFSRWVRASVQALSTHRPTLGALGPLLVDWLQSAAQCGHSSAMKKPPPELPRDYPHVLAPLQYYCEQVRRSRQRREQFLEHALQLPALLGELFGLDRLLLLFDELEAVADRRLLQALLLLMKQHAYVVAWDGATRADKLLRSLAPRDVLSTLGIISREDFATCFPSLVPLLVAEDAAGYCVATIPLEYFGGSPGYLASLVEFLQSHRSEGASEGHAPRVAEEQRLLRQYRLRRLWELLLHAPTAVLPTAVTLRAATEEELKPARDWPLPDDHLPRTHPGYKQDRGFAANAAGPTTSPGGGDTGCSSMPSPEIVRRSLRLKGAAGGIAPSSPSLRRSGDELAASPPFVWFGSPADEPAPQTG